MKVCPPEQGHTEQVLTRRPKAALRRLVKTGLWGVFSAPPPILGRGDEALSTGTVVERVLTRRLKETILMSPGEDWLHCGRGLSHSYGLRGLGQEHATSSQFRPPGLRLANCNSEFHCSRWDVSGALIWTRLSWSTRSRWRQSGASAVAQRGCSVGSRSVAGHIVPSSHARLN